MQNNHLKPKITTHVRSLIKGAKASYKDNVIKHPALLKEQSDEIVSQMISGAIPNWGGMKIQGIQLQV